MLCILGKLTPSQEEARRSALDKVSCVREAYQMSTVVLGGGNFGLVVCGKDIETGLAVAIKQFRNSPLRAIENEALLLIKFGYHANIIRCRGLCLVVRRVCLYFITADVYCDVYRGSRSLQWI
jgi:hypothetical protein